MNGRQYTVVGVVEESFPGRVMGLLPDVWVPMQMENHLYPSGYDNNNLGAARGLEGLGPEYYTGLGAEYQAKRDRLCEALLRAGLPPWVPQGSYYVLADVSRLPGATGKDRVMHLLRQTGVAAVPGEAFFRGPEGHRTARFCFGKTDADLAEACRRLEKV